MQKFSKENQKKTKYIQNRNKYYLDDSAVRLITTQAGALGIFGGNSLNVGGSYSTIDSTQTDNARANKYRENRNNNEPNSTELRDCSSCKLM